MAALTDDVKTAIVQGLACYDRPSDVAAMVKDEFGIAVTRQQLQAYDPSKKNGKNLAKKWRDLFEATREAFLKNTSEISIANRSVRLRLLEQMINKAIDRGNMALAAQLIEQSAKEIGDSYTNRVKNEHTGKNGGPIQTENLSEADMTKQVMQMFDEIFNGSDSGSAKDA